MNHFLKERLTLRNVSDWVLFVRVYADQIDFWTQWESECIQYDLLVFGHCMIYLAERVCGVKIPVEISIDIKEKSEMILSDIYSGKDDFDHSSTSFIIRLYAVEKLYKK